MGLSPAALEQATRRFQERLIAAARGLESAENPSDFCQAEREIHALTRELADSIVGDALRRMCGDALRRASATRRATERARKRGVRVRSAGVRATRVRLLGGTIVSVEAPYYRAVPLADGPLPKRGKDGTGVYPVLDQLGVLGGATPALCLRVSHAVCEASSVASARQMLAQCGQTTIDHKAALRLTYATCNVALKARKRAVRSLLAPVDGGEFAGRQVVAAIDGGRINTRRAVRGGRRRGGRRQFVTEWREPKVLTVYVLGEDGKRDRRVPAVIDGTLGDADAVFKLLRFHLFRLGAHQAQDVTLVGDGAKWIWGRAANLREDLRLPPERFHQIVDYFHAVERLWEFARTRPRWTEARAREWVKDQKVLLKRGAVERIISSIRYQKGGSRAEIDKQLPYWLNNMQRMRYAAFRDQGLPIGSGAVESAIRRVVNLRMKGASVFWKEAHAEGVLHLRAYSKSGRWAELEHTVLANLGWHPRSRQSRAA